MNDKYQEKYLKHQSLKRECLTSSYGSKAFHKYSPKEQKLFFDILKRRSSQRAFNEEPIELKPILDAIQTAPSSCNRKGVYIKPIISREDKELLSGLLVGGIGWIYRGQVILLVVADMDCYKSPAEKDFMPYLDAGVLAQTIYLTCETLGYGTCFVNPNIRNDNKEFFNQRFLEKNEILCGAIPIGKFDLKQ